MVSFVLVVVCFVYCVFCGCLYLLLMWWLLVDYWLLGVFIVFTGFELVDIDCDVVWLFEISCGICLLFLGCLLLDFLIVLLYCYFWFRVISVICGCVCVFAIVSVFCFVLSFGLICLSVCWLCWWFFACVMCCLIGGCWVWIV